MARRQISTSIVGWRGPPRIRTTPNEVKREEEHDRRRGQDRRPQQRQRDLAEGPPRRRAERRGGVLEPRVELGPQRADRAHDDGEVEEDVGDEDRPARSGRSEAGSRARKAAPTTTVGSTNGTVTRASTSAAPGEPVAGEHVGRQQADDHGERGAERGLPQREPGDGAQPGSVSTSRDAADATAPGR